MTWQNLLGFVMFLMLFASNLLLMLPNPELAGVAYRMGLRTFLVVWVVVSWELMTL